MAARRARWHHPLVKPTLPALTVVLASLLVGGCGEPGVCDGLYLRQVQTADEEADEMHNFRAECRPLSLRALDASGEPIPIAGALDARGRPLPIDGAWMAKVHHIELSGRGSRPFEHAVLDGKNLVHLTGE